MSLVQISNRIAGSTSVTVFHLQDRVNLGNYQELEKLAKEEHGRGMRNLVIDLSCTDSMTSIGLRALVVVHKILAKSDYGNHLKITGATTVMRETMQMTGISQFIEVYDTVDEAVASF